MLEEHRGKDISGGRRTDNVGKIESTVLFRSQRLGFKIGVLWSHGLDRAFQGPDSAQDL